MVLERLSKSFLGYTAFWWEKLCRQAISGTEIEGFTFGFARNWWGNVSKTERVEVDVLAESTDGMALLVGECKWTEGENAARLLFELEEKVKKLPFTAGKIIVSCLFLKTAPADEPPPRLFLPEDVVEMLR